MQTVKNTQFGACESRIFVQGQPENTSWDMAKCNYLHNKELVRDRGEGAVKVPSFVVYGQENSFSAI